MADDTNSTSDVFVHDRFRGVTERVSVDSRERQSAGAEGDGGLDTNFGPPAITPDGRYVAFASSATNLVKGDKNNAVDIFLRDRVAGTTERVSTVGRKTVANAESSRPRSALTRGSSRSSRSRTTSCRMTPTSPAMGGAR